MPRYFTKTTYQYVPHNKLAKAIQEYLKTKNRIVLESVEKKNAFKEQVLQDIEAIHKTYPRCKPISHIWNDDMEYTDVDDSSLTFSTGVPNLTIYQATN